MAIPSNRSGNFSQGNPCGWRALFLESLCGTLTVAWYLVALAERSIFSALTHLTDFTDAFLDGPTRDGGQFDVPVSTTPAYRATSTRNEILLGSKGASFMRGTPSHLQ
jgi:hypothetical protein